jgi:hypothetical protein
MFIINNIPISIHSFLQTMYLVLLCFWNLPAQYHHALANPLHSETRVHCEEYSQPQTTLPRAVILKVCDLDEVKKGNRALIWPNVCSMATRCELTMLLKRASAVLEARGFLKGGTMWFDGV